MSDNGTTYARLEDIPPETPIPLTAIDPGDGRLADFGDRAYCSDCGKQSARRARADLWAIRHKTREELPGPVWLYCRDHLPSREWIRDGDVRASAVAEVDCPQCFLRVRVGSICDATGLPH